MGRYRCEFAVNGIRTLANVAAPSAKEAALVILAQYPCHCLEWWSLTRIG